MKPTNLKALTHLLYDCANKLSERQITPEEADSMARLSKQIINAYQYENSRVQTLTNLMEFNKTHSTDIILRNLDGKPFDNIEDPTSGCNPG